MKCPLDGSDLVMSDRQGVEIDYCPKCRGVWLDRGELDKILDKSVTVTNTGPTTPDNYRDRQPTGDDRYYKKKKESWLGEIFDF